MADTERFDVHAVRHRPKLVRDDGPTALYENRDGVARPACGDPFDERYLAERRANSFAPDRRVAFCVVREDDRLLLRTHGGRRVVRNGPPRATGGPRRRPPRATPP